uniref:ADAMTS cysteine-rich domain-containing protein n=1 Tax=Magallana gigas TaxID=29159 RepID=A0A8W8IXW3_MAGGI
MLLSTNDEIEPPCRTTKRELTTKDVAIKLGVYTDSSFTAQFPSTGVSKRVELMHFKYQGVRYMKFQSDRRKWSFLKSETLGYNIKLTIMNLEFWETNPSFHNMSKKLHETLSSFCQGTRNVSHKYDISCSHTSLEKAQCLSREAEALAELSPSLIGQEYSPDDICENRYGPNFFFRKFEYYSHCEAYSCVNLTEGALYGQMFNHEWQDIPGSYCGEGKICFKQTCTTFEDARQTPKSIRPGGWGPLGRGSPAAEHVGPINHPGCEGGESNANEANICNPEIFGCDDAFLGGTKEFDECGVCGGDGSTCDVIQGTFTSIPGEGDLFRDM